MRRDWQLTSISFRIVAFTKWACIAKTSSLCSNSLVYICWWILSKSILSLVTKKRVLATTKFYWQLFASVWRVWHVQLGLSWAFSWLGLCCQRFSTQGIAWRFSSISWRLGSHFYSCLRRCLCFSTSNLTRCTAIPRLIGLMQCQSGVWTACRMCSPTCNTCIGTINSCLFLSEDGTFSS